MAIFVLPDNFETARWLREDEKALWRARNENSRLYLGIPRFGSLRPASSENTSSFGFSTFLLVGIGGFGYSSVLTQLLTVPVYIWASVVYISVSFASDYFRRRAYFMVPMALIMATGYSRVLGLPMTSTAVLYFVTFVTATGIYCVVGLNVTWAINSNAGYFKRATAILDCNKPLEKAHAQWLTKSIG
ncbi:hypothetical protein BCR34DRAFT_602558 [Clohesyomyces aquaticus]|uniref:Uncharacterized protein n=1 Tax=Clohesyomyces aquaticus TaxID=1231657 RepID=A0A1Y1ZHW7_9PLEO|nr:hypothetical protein BCR34DRAFT_602558 [Clohesyomyces aquaticus]